MLLLARMQHLEFWENVSAHELASIDRDTGMYLIRKTTPSLPAAPLPPRL